MKFAGSKWDKTLANTMYSNRLFNKLTLKTQKEEKTNKTTKVNISG